MDRAPARAPVRRARGCARGPGPRWTGRGPRPARGRRTSGGSRPPTGPAAAAPTRRGGAPSRGRRCARCRGPCGRAPSRPGRRRCARWRCARSRPRRRSGARPPGARGGRAPARPGPARWPAAPRARAARAPRAWARTAATSPAASGRSPWSMLSTPTGPSWIAASRCMRHTESGPPETIARIGAPSGSSPWRRQWSATRASMVLVTRRLWLTHPAGAAAARARRDTLATSCGRSPDWIGDSVGPSGARRAGSRAASGSPGPSRRG